MTVPEIPASSDRGFPSLDAPGMPIIGSIAVPPSAAVNPSNGPFIADDCAWTSVAASTARLTKRKRRNIRMRILRCKKNDYLGTPMPDPPKVIVGPPGEEEEEEEEELRACAATAAPAAAPAIAMIVIIFLCRLPCTTFICEIVVVASAR